MALSLQVTFRKMLPSPFVRQRVRERADKLVQFYDRVAGCRVVIEAPHRRHHKGKLYAVSVEVKVPGATLASRRKSGKHHEHEDVYVALRDSFDSIERQIEEFIRRKRGE